MWSTPTLEEKRQFLKWFLMNHQLQRREALWILNYLLNHEFLLGHVHFVEQAAQTPKGLVFASVAQEQEPAFVFVKFGKQYDNPEQAFHEIRLNWQDHLYLELRFPNSYEVMQQYGILEENPYVDEDEHNDRVQAVWQMVLESQKAQRKQFLLAQLDEALLSADKQQFDQLTEALAQLKKNE